MSRNIVWISLADGSWGGCDEDMLVTVYTDQMTDDELDSLEYAENEAEVAYILLNARNRIETPDANVEVTPLCTYIIKTRMGERHWQAEDEAHAREQHYEMFGHEDSDEEILEIRLDY